MNRSLKLSVLLALALGSSQAAALELGQIQVKSALGQPLLAEIPLNPASPAELQDLSARLASAADAAQAGVAAGPTIPLQFAVVDGGNGKKVIRITSSAPVNDPYLDLLVEVNNSTGKSLREFTILLDPPNSAASVPATSAPVQAAAKPSRRAAAAAAAPASSQSTAAAPAPAPAPAAEAKPAKPAPAPAPRVAAGGSFGPVERGQTLSAIAHQTAPDGVDVNQMLLALKQANPDAFYRDNINALKTGAVLRVPSRDDAQAMAVAAAVAEVRRQNGDWRSGAARTPTTVADAATRANASSAPTASAPAGDHLALVPAKEGADSAAGRGGKAEKAEKGMAALHDDLLRSQEALTTLQQQGNELKTRLKDLEDINGKNERLLSLKDSEIAELQHKLAEARKAAAAPAEAGAKPAPAVSAPTHTASTPATATESMAKAASSAAAPAPAVSAPTVAAAASASAPAHASTAAAVAKPPVAKPAVTPAAKPAPVAEEEPWYMQTWAWGAGAGAAVLLLLLALRGRGRKPAAVAGSPSLADRFGPAALANVGSEDPDQDELLDQLAEHPDDINLHLELVSLYYSRRDVDHFEAAAEAMHAHIGDPQQPEWQDVVHMGEDLVPEHPLFAHGAPLPPRDEDEREALGDFDLGRYAEDRDDHELPPIPSQPANTHHKVSEYHFDFDLTPRPAQAHDAAPAHASAATLEQDVEEEVKTHASTWQFAEPADDLAAGSVAHDGEFSDDPVDTKLDLARAYLDMGDPDGAHAMLEEVMHEGTQMQKDVAKRLLDSIR
ncbi:FimV/HubP family polar landmark protein [Dyella soli]|uniref:Fimbrial protein FimV n=1 Tax=Dyella soli TaxID=522319 RepID=A0A4R0YLM6_9GAMM|nr:FimV/HubP family polar landmark protein [Dyella soli]TCI09749.1 fimbrial protein FimV [Dyella soli]